MQPNQDDITVAVPAHNADEGINFLESLSAGNIGAGLKMTSFGQTIPSIRQEYKLEIERFEKELQSKQANNVKPKELAKWAVNERKRIAQKMRAKQGGGSQIILELRDNIKYGLGGRSYENLEKRALNQGVPKVEVPQTLLKKATTPNSGISKAAIDGAKFLKHGGRVVVVISISVTAYTLLTAPQDQLEKILYQEAGGITGGVIGGGTAVGLCILFGIATSGWGLLACGVVGGGAGGIAGAEAGNRIYLLKEDYIKNSNMGRNGFDVYDPDQFSKSVNQKSAH
jgi:hypothetical protein